MQQTVKPLNMYEECCLNWNILRPGKHNNYVGSGYEGFPRYISLKQISLRLRDGTYKTALQHPLLHPIQARDS